jgi:hypothetical protein
VEIVGEMNGFNYVVSEDDAEPHRHLAIVEINYHWIFAIVVLFLTAVSINVSHVLAIKLNHILSFVEAHNYF